MIIVTPSQWLASYVRESFLSNYPIEVIYNGIDLNVFTRLNNSQEIKRKYNLTGKKIILGVASIWSKRKGLSDFIELSKSLLQHERIVLVGLNRKQMKALPSNVIGLSRTENVNELANLYNAADVFVNPTYLDNFPSSNIEALACGTPVITYKTGGCPEAVDTNTGVVLPKGDVAGIRNAINNLAEIDQVFQRTLCEERARKFYNWEVQYDEYLSLYHRLVLHDNE
jgi:glycosyltransferase involved in cell wall biosynthesis